MKYIFSVAGWWKGDNDDENDTSATCPAYFMCDSVSG